MPLNDRLLKRAIALSRAGEKREARRLLEGIIQAEPDNETAWFWYVDTFETPGQRILILERFLQDHPGNPRALGAIERLKEETNTSHPAIQSNVPSGQARPYKTDDISPQPMHQPQPPIPAPFSHAPEPAAHSHFTPPPTPTQRTDGRRSSESVPRRRRHRTSSWGVVLAGGVLILAAILIAILPNTELTSLRRQNQALRTQVNSLNTQNETINEAYTGLQSATQSAAQLASQGSDSELTVKFEALSAEHQRLLNNYQTLEEQYQQIEQNYQVLQSNFTQLEQTLQKVNGELSQLKDTALLPPFIFIQQRTITMTFYSTQKQLIKWTLPFDMLEETFRKGEAARADMRSPENTLILTAKEGSSFRVIDFRPYVDPSPFYGMMATLYAQAGDDEAFIKEVWNIITQLTTYSNEMTETPRFPLETLLAGGGDCEDTVILFASLIKAAPVNWTVSFVYLDSDFPDAPQTVNHIMVRVETGKTSYLIETTSKAQMTPLANVEGWFFEVK
jgi:chaperonin cofactor prefoldin